jgi:hypothetical protein
VNGHDTIGAPPQAGQQQQPPEPVLSKAEEIEVWANGAGPGGAPALMAVILVSPTRFYVDLKIPELLQDHLIMLNSGTAVNRRASLHQFLEHWMRIARPAKQQQPKPEPAIRIQTEAANAAVETQTP